jgi:biopolymer transport protein TolR
MSEINVVPYIDVMLVLLVIFMATAPLLTQGVQVDLPQAPSKAIDTEEPDPLVVSMRKDGAMFLNIGLASRTKKEEDGTRVTIFSLSEQAGKVLRVPRQCAGIHQGRCVAALRGRSQRDDGFTTSGREWCGLNY